MSAETSKVNSILDKTNRLLVKNLFKWILPVGVTFAIVFFARKDNNSLVLFILWLFHCLAYITIPHNFENPRKEKFRYLNPKNQISSALWVTMQAIMLGAALFILTFVLIIWYFPGIKTYSTHLSLINGSLYSLSIFLASYITLNSYKNT